MFESQTLNIIKEKYPTLLQNSLQIFNLKTDGEFLHQSA